MDSQQDILANPILNKMLQLLISCHMCCHHSVDMSRLEQKMAAINHPPQAKKNPVGENTNGIRTILPQRCKDTQKN
jgi:hypothetical protein